MKNQKYLYQSACNRLVMMKWIIILRCMWSDILTNDQQQLIESTHIRSSGINLDSNRLVDFSIERFQIDVTRLMAWGSCKTLANLNENANEWNKFFDQALAQAHISILARKYVAVPLWIGSYRYSVVTLFLDLQKRRAVKRRYFWINRIICTHFQFPKNINLRWHTKVVTDVPTKFMYRSA